MDKEGRIPSHVAIIMDGNGRWAKQKGMDRIQGHMNGVESVRACLRAAVRGGVRYLTLYAFSTENWGRPKKEIDALMELLCKSVIEESPELQAQGVRVVMIGQREGLSDKVLEHVTRIERETAAGERLTVLLALNYSSTSELTVAVRNIAAKVVHKELQPARITETTIEKELYTAPFPNPDLLIRTSGEQRLSNFMLWQLAYAELYFTPTLWPDFREEDFERALEAYAARERRYGLITPQ